MKGEDNDRTEPLVLALSVAPQADRAKVGEHMRPQDASEKTEMRNVETDVMSTGSCFGSVSL